MATKTKKEVTSTEETVDIADFFCVENEEKGVWLQPELDGIKPEYELLLRGFNSKEAEDTVYQFEKDLKVLEDAEDNGDTERKRKAVIAKRASVFIKDIRGIGGKKLVVHGEPLEFSPELAETMCLQNRFLSRWIMETLNKPNTFIGVKKKD